MKNKWYIFYFFQVTVMMINLIGCYASVVMQAYWLTGLYFLAVLLGFWLIWFIAKRL